jgi:cobalamin biosynthesis protein CobD/CbiB
MPIDLDSLALIIMVGLVFGQPLAWLTGVGYLTRASHRIVHALGRKMNRERRSIATRAARGFTVPLMLMLLAVCAGTALLMLPVWLGMLGVPQIVALLPGYAIIAAMLSPQRYLLPLWHAVTHAKHDRWGALDTPLTTMAAGPVAAADGHGRARLISAIALQQFMHGFLGSIAALLLAGPIGLCLYRVIQLAANHYDGHIVSFRGFHWASEKLARLLALPVLFVAAFVLTLAGQLLAATDPLRGFWRMVRAKQGVSFVAWVAHSLTMTLGGPCQWYGHTCPRPWVGSGTAKLTSIELARLWWWLAISSLLVVLGVATIAANFQTSDFQYLFDIAPNDFTAILS